LDRLIALIPPSPPYFDKDALTDKTERFFVSEIVREQILLNYKKEVPYSVEVDVEEFKGGLMISSAFVPSFTWPAIHRRESSSDTKDRNLSKWA
jgi:hypothetical protein